MNTIFISYRRSDSSDVTGRIFDQLRLCYGSERLFKDVDSIPYGADFRNTIEEAVSRCGVLLAVIGDDWLSIVDDMGNRRIDNTNDYVNIEISLALTRGITVIPVLVEGTEMPSAHDLPENLRPLVYRNAARVRPDPDFHNDINRLCKQLASHGFSISAQNPRWNHQRVFAASVLLFCSIGVFAFALLAISGVIGNSSQNGDIQNPTESGTSGKNAPKLILDAPVDFVEE